MSKKSLEDCSNLLQRILEHNSSKITAKLYLAQIEEKFFVHSFLKAQFFGYKLADTPALLNTEGVFDKYNAIPERYLWNIPDNDFKQGLYDRLRASKPLSKSLAFDCRAESFPGLHLVIVNIPSCEKWLKDHNIYTTKSPIIWFEGPSLKFSRPNGLGQLNLSENENPYFLLQAFVKILLSQGSQEGPWYVVNANRADLVRELLKLRIKNKNMHDWVRFTRNNLLKKIISQSFKEVIEISSFDRKSNCYTFRIKTS